MPTVVTMRYNSGVIAAASLLVFGAETTRRSESRDRICKSSTEVVTGMSEHHISKDERQVTGTMSEWDHQRRLLLRSLHPFRLRSRLPRALLSRCGLLFSSPRLLANVSRPLLSQLNPLPSLLLSIRKPIFRNHRQLFRCPMATRTRNKLRPLMRRENDEGRSAGHNPRMRRLLVSMFQPSRRIRVRKRILA